jgi:hypothetical protein
MDFPNIYQSDDLALIVWLHQTGPAADRGEITWHEAATVAWAMSQDKAERTRVLIGVYDEKIRCAWGVVRHDGETAPAGKSGRNVYRAKFHVIDDPRLAELDGLPSPLDGRGRRNPQATVELRDLPILAPLLGEPTPVVGVVRVGGFVLSVSELGGACTLYTPPGAPVNIRSIDSLYEDN